MKVFIITSLIFSTVAFGQATKNKNVGAPANAVSRGSSENSGISDGPIGPDKEEAKNLKAKNESMGGAPNAGGGMATGTGAGSTVGNKLKKGTVTAGDTSGGAEE